MLYYCTPSHFCFGAKWQTIWAMHFPPNALIFWYVGFVNWAMLVSPRMSITEVLHESSKLGYVSPSMSIIEVRILGWEWKNSQNSQWDEIPWFGGYGVETRTTKTIVCVKPFDLSARWIIRQLSPMMITLSSL